MLVDNVDGTTHRRAVVGFRDAATLLKALAHPVRLQIMTLLSQGEACVCHLQAVLRKRQPYISQQLMTLRDAGLVADRRDGAIVYYRAASADLGPVLAWARAELTRQGLAPLSLEPPRLPVDGCSCPRCAQARRGEVA